MESKLISGVYALKVFILCPDDATYPLQSPVYTQAGSYSWNRTQGKNFCVESVHDPVDGPLHLPPSHSDTCECGIYSSKTLWDAGSYLLIPPANAVVAILSLEGDVLEYEEGYRSESARVVALTALRGGLDDLRNTFFEEEVEIFDDILDMIQVYDIPVFKTNKLRPLGEAVARHRTFYGVSFILSFVILSALAMTVSVPWSLLLFVIVGISMITYMLAINSDMKNRNEERLMGIALGKGGALWLT